MRSNRSKQNKRSNNQNTKYRETQTGKAISSKYTNRKKTRKNKKRRKFTKKIILGVKVTILAIFTLLFLAVISFGLVWIGKYLLKLYMATVKAIHAWYNFFTYLHIPEEIKTKVLGYLTYIAWGSIGIISLIIFRKLYKFTISTNRKRSSHDEKSPTTLTIKANSKPEGNNRSKAKILTLRNTISENITDDIIEVDIASPEKKNSFSGDDSDESVLILGPKGKDIVMREWENDDIYSTNNEASTTTNRKRKTPKEDKGHSSKEKVIPLRATSKRSSSQALEIKKETTKTVKQMNNQPVDETIPLHLISYTPPDYLEKIQPEAEKNAQIILDLLSEFGIDGEIDKLQIGPRVSRYEIKIPKGTRVDKIKRLSNDIATALGVRNIRLELSVPGKPQTVAIEVPNSISGTVHISSILRSNAFKKLNTPTPLVLGLDVTGKPVVEDLRKQPHLLIAGATGSGKSVCINTILIGMLMKSSPDNLKLMLVDPKRVELSPYSRLPHLIFPILTEANEAVAALEWMIREMDRRYKMLREVGVRSIEAFNKKVSASQKLPYIVIVIDELADLMMVSAGETEQKIARLAQLARAAGIHLILATQRPSTDVITGLIKANIPARVAFAVSSQIDSRVILDHSGAEKLLGMGDMLFVSPRYRHPIRIQGAYTSDEDIDSIVEYWSSKYPQQFEELNLIELSSSNENTSIRKHSYDPLIKEAWKLIVQYNRPSVSFLQRKLRVGFNRASRIMEELEELGVVSPPEGPQGKRQILRTDYDNEP